MHVLVMPGTETWVCTGPCEHQRAIWNQVWGLGVDGYQILSTWLIKSFDSRTVSQGRLYACLHRSRDTKNYSGTCVMVFCPFDMKRLLACLLPRPRHAWQQLQGLSASKVTTARLTVRLCKWHLDLQQDQDTTLTASIVLKHSSTALC